MFGALVILGVAVASYLAWRAWVRSRELDALCEQSRKAAAELNDAMRRHRDLQEAVNARLQDLHRSLSKACCGRETVWPE